MEPPMTVKGRFMRYLNRTYRVLPTRRKIWLDTIRGQRQTCPTRADFRPWFLPPALLALAAAVP